MGRATAGVGGAVGAGGGVGGHRAHCQFWRRATCLDIDGDHLLLIDGGYIGESHLGLHIYIYY